MNRMKRLSAILLAAVMLASLLAVGAAAAAPAFKLYYVFDKSSYNVGDSATVNLYLERTDTTGDYELFDFTDYITFNTTYLQYTGGTAGPGDFRLDAGTGGGGTQYTGNMYSVSLRYQTTSLSAPKRTAKLLAATMTFKVLADCETSLTHRNVEVWTTLNGSGGESVTAEPGTVTAGTPDYFNISFTGGTGASGSVAPIAKVPAGSYIKLPTNGYTNSGKTFKGWFDGSTIRAAGASYYVTSNVSFTAAWSPAKVTYSGGSGGDVKCVNSGNVLIYSGSTVDVGTRLTFTATPNKNFKFSVWGDGSTENPHTITVIGDVNFASPFVSTLASGTTSAASVVVDGKDYNIGKSTVSGDTTTVTVDKDALTEQLKSASSSVVVPVSADTTVAEAQLVVENVEDMAAKNMTLTVQAGSVSYNIPTKAVDTAEIMKDLGASDPAQVPVTVTITQLEPTDVNIKNGTLVIPPVEFTVTATYGDKTYEVESFANYVSRVITIPSGVDAAKITTAVVVENGKERHVPTYVYMSGGVWYAKINSLTNSTYALVYNTASFTDSKNTWYDAAVTEMASRMIINGVGGGRFEGGRSITRAEFASIIVRALGLPQNGSASAFKDVPSGAWYYGAVGKAYEYGIVDGRGAASFDPMANITRQEAMAIIQRAARIAGMTGSGSGSLSAFTDAGSVSSWAKDAVSFNVASGLIVGSDGKLNPTNNITRAETAAVILRMLQHSGLIDVRT
jgi:hypothetical protein